MLLTMITDERLHIRELGFRRVLKARSVENNSKSHNNALPPSGRRVFQGTGEELFQPTTDINEKLRCSTPKTQKLTVGSTGLVNNSLKEKLEHSLTQNNLFANTDMLTLAAEAGNALLLENDKLKQELHDMKQQFSSLKCQDFRDNNFAEVNLAEAKIEELENDKEILLSRNASLVETLNEVELQLEKERQLRIEMMRTFEEQDNEREKLLRDSANKIKQLGGMINKLKLNQDDKTDLAQTPKPTSTSETQTNDSEFYVPNYCASLITELAQLKTRQDQLERSVETLQEELHKQGEQTNPATPPPVTQSTPVTESFPRSKNYNLSKKKKTNWEGKEPFQCISPSNQKQSSACRTRQCRNRLTGR
ncbi:hypothetical protein J6590_056225 [Homalodisca vitripennis]|nr:hypothetical protein J6590_056225 [Homalodisca vitripennis]